MALIAYALVIYYHNLMIAELVHLLIIKYLLLHLIVLSHNALLYLRTLAIWTLHLLNSFRMD